MAEVYDIQIEKLRCERERNRQKINLLSASIEYLLNILKNERSSINQNSPRQPRP